MPGVAEHQLGYAFRVEAALDVPELVLGARPELAREGILEDPCGGQRSCGLRSVFQPRQPS